MIKEKWPYILVIALLILGGFIYSQCNRPKATVAWENQPPPKEEAVKPPQQESKNVKEEPKVVQIYVDLKGSVNHPGVYQMNKGDRVIDVLQKAGGLTKKADKSKVNLALKLVDEMMIYIPAIGEKVPSGIETSQVATVGTSDVSNGKININTASEKELEEIPGIGPSKAAAIIEYRKKNGPYKTIQDLDKVSGIGEKSIDRMKGQITAE